MEKLVEIGLSGWIIFIISMLSGGGIIAYQVIIRRTRQSNIRAGGDVAGGDIIKGEKNDRNGNGSATKVSRTVQENVTAKGDVAGGDIIKGDE